MSDTEREFKRTIKRIVTNLSRLTPLEVSRELRIIYEGISPVYARTILLELLSVNEALYGEDDSWWDEMMREAGEDINRLL
jgi:hypothetical protein